jgi:hypothetical protein
MFQTTRKTLTTTAPTSFWALVQHPDRRGEQSIAFWTIERRDRWVALSIAEGGRLIASGTNY